MPVQDHSVHAEQHIENLIEEEGFSINPELASIQAAAHHHHH